MPLSIGQVINNRYRITKLIGQGGFGAIYRAWDLNLDLPRAVKENLETSQQAQSQFKREAQILSKLSHPNLPRVTDHFIIPDQGQYLVMDFIEGVDLRELLQNGPIPETQAIPWIIQVCEALSYLHTQNPSVIHRDIKPGNIKITPEGKAMLVDFGISKIYDPTLSTTIGARAVTPGYSPPEQYGKGATDVRSDIYALGATLYHLLTGQLPPDSVDLISRNAPTPPSVIALNPAVSEVVSAAVSKAMALDRDARWNSAQEFKQAITLMTHAVIQPDAAAFPVTPVVAASPLLQIDKSQKGAVISSRKIPRSWLGAAGALGLVLVLFVAGLIGLMTRDGEKTPSSNLTVEVVGVVPVDTTAPIPNGTPATRSADSRPDASVTSEPLTITETWQKTSSPRKNLTPTGERQATSTSFTLTGKLSDIPVMPGAKDIQVKESKQGEKTAQSVTYAVNATGAEIIAFFDREMPSYGWTRIGDYEYDLNQIGGVFIKGKRGLVLTIDQESTPIKVQMIIAEG